MERRRPTNMEIDKGAAKSNVIAEKGEEAGMDTMRIFVGGLGEGVTDGDLRRMFVALGSVDEIEIIRTKGRSMAYLNFTPSSAKSLAKLFSSFNGCVWKGGRLRIEKAKEHYLVNMKKEKEQEHEEELARNIVAMKCSAASEVVNLKKPIKGPGAEKEQLRIFFPKLRKVKPLPFSGCGKHKYSFRNIQVPPLPIHFCDCEIHSVPYDTPIGNVVVNYDAPQSGVDEKEFDLMKSVLNKFISRDEISSVKADSDGPIEDTGPYSVSNDILPSEDNPTNSEPDEDGIIMNISGATNEINFSWTLENKTVSENQESRGNRPRALKVDDKKLPVSNEKRKLDHEENNASMSANLKRKKYDLNGVSVLPQENNPIRAQKPKWKELVGQGSESSFKISNVLSPGSAQDLVQQEDTEEESSKSEETDDETEASTDDSTQQEDTEEESIKSEELGNEAEESTDASAQQENTEEEQNKSEELDDEAVASAENSAQQEDSEEVLNESEDHDGLEEVSIKGFGSESTKDSVEHDEYEVESSKSDDLDNFEETELSSVSPLIRQNGLEQLPPKSEENKHQGGVNPTETVDGSVKFKKGPTWSQKMPWTQLVSDMDNSSFSISQILPGSTSENQVTPRPDLKSKDSSTIKSSKAVMSEAAAVSAVSLTNPPTDLHEKKNLNNSVNCSATCNPCGAFKSEDEKPATTQANCALKQVPVVKTEACESRPFVRCAASLKEWAKLKENLRRSRTKKRKIVEE
ncbi:unnamed protein product [Rhodiola kirilowii]